jgi:hypothetical protein
MGGREMQYGSIRERLGDYRLIALVPSCAVLLDYTLTYILSGGANDILAHEYSPLVRAAVAHNLFVPYLVGMICFYYVVAYAALRMLYPTKLYAVGVLLILLVSATHVLGGLSWHIRSAGYVMVVHGLSALGIAVALAAAGYAVLTFRTGARRL